MSSLSDFLDSAKEEISNVSEFLNSKEIEPLVKVGEEKQGNISAADIEAGKTAKVEPINAELGLSSLPFKITMPVVLGAAIIGWYLLKKRV